MDRTIGGSMLYTKLPSISVNIGKVDHKKHDLASAF